MSGSDSMSQPRTSKSPESPTTSLTNGTREGSNSSVSQIATIRRSPPSPTSPSSPNRWSSNSIATIRRSQSPDKSPSTQSFPPAASWGAIPVINGNGSGSHGTKRSAIEVNYVLNNVQVNTSSELRPLNRQRLDNDKQALARAPESPRISGLAQGIAGVLEQHTPQLFAEVEHKDKELQVARNNNRVMQMVVQQLTNGSKDFEKERADLQRERDDLKHERDQLKEQLQLLREQNEKTLGHLKKEFYCGMTRIMGRWNDEMQRAIELNICDRSDGKVEEGREREHTQEA